MARAKTKIGRKGNSVTAILIDPDDCKITEVRLAVRPLHDGVHTNSVKPDDVCRLLDSKRIGAFVMPPVGNDACFFNEDRLRSDKGHGFQFDETCDVMRGKILLIGFALENHTYKDVSFPITSLRETVIWSRCAGDGDKTTPATDEGALDQEFKESL